MRGTRASVVNRLRGGTPGGMILSNTACMSGVYGGVIGSTLGAAWSSGDIYPTVTNSRCGSSHLVGLPASGVSANTSPEKKGTFPSSRPIRQTIVRRDRLRPIIRLSMRSACARLDTSHGIPPQDDDELEVRSRTRDITPTFAC